MKAKAVHRVFKMGHNEKFVFHVVCGASSVGTIQTENNEEVTCKTCLKVINTKNHFFYGNKLKETKK